MLGTCFLVSVQMQQSRTSQDKTCISPTQLALDIGLSWAATLGLTGLAQLRPCWVLLIGGCWGQCGILMGGHWCCPFPKVGPIFPPPKYHQMPKCCECVSTLIPSNAHLNTTKCPSKYHQMPT